MAGFRLMDVGKIDVVQVDLTRCGLTEAMKIASLAADRGLPVVNHGFTTYLNVAAALHFLASIPNAVSSSSISSSPSRRSAAPWRSPIPIVDGHARVPEEPARLEPTRDHREVPGAGLIGRGGSHRARWQEVARGAEVVRGGDAILLKPRGEGAGFALPAPHFGLRIEGGRAELRRACVDRRIEAHAVQWNADRPNAGTATMPGRRPGR